MCSSDLQVGVLASPAHPDLRYLGDDAATARTFREVDGVRCCIPGDLATVHPDGTITLLGRDGRVINTGGEKVFAEEVEAALLTHPDVEDAVVVGRPHELWGSEVVAVVAMRPASDVQPERLREFVGTRLANYKAPKRVVQVAEIARKANGKADLQWARELSG